MNQELDGLKPSSSTSHVLKSERTVLHVLFPEVRAQLLSCLFGLPQKQRYVRQLMSTSGLALHTVQDELRKLTAVGLVTSWSNGYHRFYRANRDHPLYRQLTYIVELSKKLPRPRHSALSRPEPRRHAKKQRRRRPQPLPPDRLVSWGLFSPKAKTRRL
jgi:hypothetical protein